MFCCVMMRRPPRSTRTDTLFPYPTLFRSVPASAEIYEQLSKDLADDLIVPVLFGSAEQGHGITRLWKALRHETPDPAVTAARLGIPAGSSLAASVIRTYPAPRSEARRGGDECISTCRYGWSSYH